MNMFSTEKEEEDIDSDENIWPVAIPWSIVSDTATSASCRFDASLKHVVMMMLRTVMGKKQDVAGRMSTGYRAVKSD